MRSGKHYVSFQVNDDNPSENLGVSCGIMRPTTNDITTLIRNCHPAQYDLSAFSLKEYETLHHNNIDCCLMNTYFGDGYVCKGWKSTTMLSRNQVFHWEGREPTREVSFKIGMVLDLDEGTLDVYKNDRRLGTLRSGLVGEYCWVVTKACGGGGLSFSIGRR